MFTRLSQFTYGQYHIPNIKTVSTNNDTALLIHLQKYEEEALRMAIGDCLYRDFVSNLEIDENGFYVLKEDADEKWDWLLNGHTYEAEKSVSGCGCQSGNCKTHVWNGIVRKVAKIEDKDVFESILAPYVYFQWNMNYRTLSTGVGEAKGIANGTVLVSGREKRVDAWNDFIAGISVGFPNSRVSLYQFLSNHKELFPEFQSVCFKPITYWDI